jgi:hypothetical protein
VPPVYPAFHIERLTWSGSTYFVGTAPKTYTEARDVCRNACGDLASLETKEEFERVFGVVKSVALSTGRKGWLWVSARRVNDAKDFKWPSEASLKEEDEAWATGEPDGAGSGENCVIMMYFESTVNAYSSKPCTSTYHPLCEMPGLKIWSDGGFPDGVRSAWIGSDGFGRMRLGWKILDQMG